MGRYRAALPQLDGDVFLSDGGIETTLVFHDGRELPGFAVFPLLEDEAACERLRRYFDTYIASALEHGVGFVLESVTWRANADWGRKLGYSADALGEANRRAIELLESIRNERETPRTPMVISGCVGPRGDGYVPGERMSSQEAADYHRAQIKVFSETAADMVSAMTMNQVEEASGIAMAARAAGLPSAIAFTVETNGRLPSGQPLKEAVEQVDSETGAAPAYYMINCAHPTHFADALESGEAWLQRLRGLRANASALSHAELDEATELDAGDPDELARQYRELMDRLPQLRVLGGCCGTDHRHVAAIAKACAGTA